MRRNNAKAGRLSPTTSQVASLATPRIGDTCDYIHDCIKFISEQIYHGRNQYKDHVYAEFNYNLSQFIYQIDLREVASIEPRRLSEIEGSSLR